MNRELTGKEIMENFNVVENNVNVSWAHFVESGEVYNVVEIKLLETEQEEMYKFVFTPDDAYKFSFEDGTKTIYEIIEKKTGKIICYAVPQEPEENMDEETLKICIALKKTIANKTLTEKTIIVNSILDILDLKVETKQAIHNLIFKPNKGALENTNSELSEVCTQLRGMLTADSLPEKMVELNRILEFLYFEDSTFKTFVDAQGKEFTEVKKEIVRQVFK